MDTGAELNASVSGYAYAFYDIILEIKHPTSPPPPPPPSPPNKK